MSSQLVTKSLPGPISCSWLMDVASRDSPSIGTAPRRSSWNARSIVWLGPCNVDHISKRDFFADVTLNRFAIHEIGGDDIFDGEAERLENRNVVW